MATTTKEIVCLAQSERIELKDSLEIVLLEFALMRESLIDDGIRQALLLDLPLKDLLLGRSSTTVVRVLCGSSAQSASTTMLANIPPLPAAEVAPCVPWWCGGGGGVDFSRRHTRVSGKYILASVDRHAKSTSNHCWPMKQAIDQSAESVNQDFVA
jgi:hypothetical protein